MAAVSTILSDLPRHQREAVRFYWETRTKQLKKQIGAGTKDQGLRSAVTRGAQMDGFIELLTGLVVAAGLGSTRVHLARLLQERRKRRLAAASDQNLLRI